MITMMDEIFDRNYQAGRAQFNAGLDRGFGRIGKALSSTFEALHRIQWNAPWVNTRDVGHA
jgi:hypothetical protein